MKKIDLLPIKWFGDREAYRKSPIKAITVGLNPSDMEFREKGCNNFSSKLRFPDYNGDKLSLDMALNNYFKNNPYRWFQSFEHILNGLDASYYDKDEYTNRALHTDICSPWATDPTWSKLSNIEKRPLIQEGFTEWELLVKDLSPDVIIFSVSQEYIKKLILDTTLHSFVEFPLTKSGNLRKRPVVINTSKYNGTLCIFGRTWNIPFGALGAEQKNELGMLIKKEYQNGK